MAKTLLHSSKYTVDKATNSIQYKGNIGLERILLITNVTANKVVYQFNDPLLGGEVFYLNQDDESTLQLTKDLSTDADINTTDVYQFFYDANEVHFSPDESLLDPVSKLRVSNPENLVDTDFEYGLQSTKWETIQTVNNIPTVYSSSGDSPLEGVLSVQAIDGSKQVKVECNTPHNLNIGDPVSVQGVIDYQAEGYFVVSGVADALTFFFEIDVVASTTGDISGSYTSIVPAKFFEGAPLNINTSSGAKTDEKSPSKIEVTTDATHGFTAGTKLYLRNTIGPKKLVITDPTATAPDGRPFVDTDAFFTIDNVIDSTVSSGRPSFQEKPVIAYDWESTHTSYLETAAVDTANNRITWTGHQMQSKFAVIFNTPRYGDSNLNTVDGTVFFVKRIDDDTIELYTDEALTTQHTFSTYTTDYGKCKLGLVYLMTRVDGYYTFDAYTRYYTESIFTATTPYLQTPLRYYGAYYDYLRVDDQLGFVPDELNVFNIQLYGQGIYYYYYYVYLRFDNGNAYNALYYRWSSNYSWVSAGVPNQTLRAANGEIYTDGTGHYIRLYHYLGSGYGYHYVRMQATGTSQTNPGNEFSGSDLISQTYGLGTTEPDLIFVANTQTPILTANPSYPYQGDGISDSYDQIYSRFATVHNRNTAYMPSSSYYQPSQNGAFQVESYGFGMGGGYNNESTPQVFYGFGRNLTSDKNTFYKSNHGIPNQQEATVTVQNYDSVTQTFKVQDYTDQIVMPQQFDVQINVVNDNVFRMELLNFQHPQYGYSVITDDYITFPDDFTVTYRRDNELYNTVYINNHKITSTSEATYLTEGMNEANPEIYAVTEETSAWGLSGTRLGRDETNPDLILYRGETYNFNIDAAATDNFYLTTADPSVTWSSGGYDSEYTTGVTGSRATGSGTLAITVDATAPNTLYYASGSVQTRAGSITVRDVGTPIGGTTNATDYNLNRVNDSRLSLQETSNTVASATTSDFGATNSNPGTTSINAWTPLGITPTNVTITGVEYRGDFSSRNEYVVITFDDGDSYFIGQQNGQDTSNWREEQFFGTKNITALVDGSGNFNVAYAPTSQINYAPSGMSNYWEIRFIVTGGTGVVTLSSGGTGEQVLNVASLKGAYDGVFEMVETSAQNTFKVQTDFEIPAREYAFTNTDCDFSNHTITFTDPHNFVTGEQLIYDNGGNGDMISYDTSNDNVTVYAVVIDATVVKISTSELGAVDGVTTTLITQAGTHKLISTSVMKGVPGPGTVTVQQGKKEVVGSGTNFLTQFKKFDKVFITQSDYTKLYTVDKVTENEKLFVFEDFTASGTATSYFFITEMVLRPDGYGLHLPFDGGVNITAGTSPDSKIVRQSRKYFRYQSGKGIQNSFAINFNPPKIVRDLIKSTGTTAAINTQEAHNLRVGDTIVIEGAEVSIGTNTFNGEFAVTAVNSPFQFTYTMLDTPTQAKAAGFPTYHRKNWTDSYIRAGMFDDQNGFFYEYDGQALYAVRRSSTKQIAGTVNVKRQSQIVTGNDTSFVTQLNVGNYVVIRGQSYRIVAINSDANFTIQPAYRGVDATRVKTTVTIDTRVPQTEWNIDKCDGTGLHGYYLDINRIQMAYADYSWYGAGKIRFGFKDQNGHVKYVHEFKHNNILNESYFRSGNLPGRYEILNGSNASTAPTLFHFGTSIIMDGTFDNDKAYLFTANSKPFAFTNGQSFTFNSTDQSSFQQITLNGNRVWVYAFECSQSNAETVSTGLLVTESTNLPSDTYVTQVQIAGANSKIFTSYPATSTLPPTSIYPTIATSTTFTFGETDGVDLTRPIPLISARLAPSVDSSLTGVVGEREIINRMQLQLKQAGVTANQDIEVFLILNPQPSNMDFTKVASPSLSELIEHDSGDTLEGGTVVYALKVSTGSTEIDLSELLELGNSILGGDSIFPAGPDLLTVAVQPQNSSGIDQNTPFRVSGKLSWSESQA
tara:strand:- start:5773 stop:11604 length:5832 start_codon:yes stop_codon:yes gene_type:complete